MKKVFNFQYFFLVVLSVIFSLKSAPAQEIKITPITPAVSQEAGQLSSDKLGAARLSPEIQQKIEAIGKSLAEPAQPKPKLEQPVGEPSKPASETEQAEPAAVMTGEPDMELSDFERFVTGKAPTTISMSIKQFGYDLFMKPPTTFAPVTNVPVGPDYVIGPGDEIKVMVWGKIEANWAVTVSRDGNISLPKAGVIGVTGLTFRELKALLKKELSRYYTGFEMNVSMGSLRTIRVYIVGNALRPGAYTVSSLSTLINALFEAGGPGKTGTMRNIQIKRNGKTIGHFDMYDFLLKGDKTMDVRLMPEDVIFIPPVGPLVGIAGKVTTPAIYELKGETDINELIEMAGGITALAYLQRIQLERVQNNEVKVLLDTNLKELTREKDIILQDRDIIKVFPISDVITNAVVLKGNITRPGKYQWFKGMRISDLLKDPVKDLLPETYYDHALIERYIPPDYHKEILFFKLGKALFEQDESEDKQLNPFDTITVYSKWDFKEKPVARITGAVNKPGSYELKPNMRLSDLISLAGGVKRYAFVKEAELTRINITQEGPKTEKILINIEDALKLDPESNISLKADDYLFIRTVPEWKLYQTVSITGEVKFPGTYTIKKGENLSSLIKRAGGYTDKAYLRGAVFTREAVREIQQKSIDEMVTRLERELISAGTAAVATALSREEIEARKAELEGQKRFIESLKDLKANGRMSIVLAHLRLLRGSEYDIELEENDSLHIPTQKSSVNVMGSVMSRGSFIYSDRLDYKDYISLAGGYSKHADIRNVYVLKVDGTAQKLSGGLLNWNLMKSRWEMTAFGEDIKKIEPGDSIIVPEKFERIAWLREIKDLTQILYQIAVSAAVVIEVL